MWAWLVGRLRKKGAIRLGEEDATREEQCNVLPTDMRNAVQTIDPGCSDARLLCESLLASVWILFCRGLIGVDKPAADFTFYRRIVNALLAIPVLVGCVAALAILQHPPRYGHLGGAFVVSGVVAGLALPWTLVITETASLPSELRLLAFGGVGLVQLSMLLGIADPVPYELDARTSDKAQAMEPLDSYMVVSTE